MLKLTCALILSAVLALAADVSGTWQFTLETNLWTENATVVFRQKGEQLTGTFSGQIFGGDITGSVKGNAIEFGFECEEYAGMIKVSYKGTIYSPTAMRGTAVYSRIYQNVTWTATKK